MELFRISSYRFLDLDRTLIAGTTAHDQPVFFLDFARMNSTTFLHLSGRVCFSMHEIGRTFGILFLLQFVSVRYPLAYEPLERFCFRSSGGTHPSLSLEAF
jgi:hypothetical protein